MEAISRDQLRSLAAELDSLLAHLRRVRREWEAHLPEHRPMPANDPGREAARNECGTVH
jgi:hypothetical protein